MRSIMALFGSCLVPISYLIVWEVSRSLPASFLAALCVLCDTLMHRLNTLLLLDPLLLTSMLTAVYGSLKFNSQRDWSRGWWAWLVFTAVCLGVVVSIKYVGVFTVCAVGIHTAAHIITIMLDSKRPLWVVIPHVFVRLFVFISVASVVYLSSFVLHFMVLERASVNGGGMCHTEFYASFKGNEYENATFPEHVHYGANIHIQNSRPIVGYLESWYDLFPASLTAPCQQVTTSPTRDEELLTWTIKKVDLEAGAVMDGGGDGDAVLVRSGDFVMVTHNTTGRSLRSHGYRAAVTRRQLQVCGYGDDGVGGPFETWQLLVDGQPLGTPLGVVRQNFMLKHYKMDCYLRGNEMAKLPIEWSFNGAKEVTCTKNKEDTGILWHINWNYSPKLSNEAVAVRSLAGGLMRKIYHQHLNMFIGNTVLVVNSEEEQRTARPWMWPLLWQMQTMGTYVVDEATGEEHFAVGMSNPFITYVNLLCLFGVPLLGVTHAFYTKRRPDQDLNCVGVRVCVLRSCGWLGLCWAIHYLPFFFMSRILYYHHYCPSYLFSCMITGVMLSWVCESASRRVKRREGLYHSLLFLCAFLISLSYMAFFPLATYVKGKQFEGTERLNPYLDYFHFGQLWPEFGYRMEEYVSVTATQVIAWNETNFDNKDINATLYFLTPLNYTSEASPNITPVAASLYSLWNSNTTTTTTTGYLSL